MPNSEINSQLENLKLDVNDNLSEKLASIGFSEEHIPYIDGSSYLIDTDNDGLVDKIGILLVDQGYFDLSREVGFIRDPIVPIDISEDEIAQNPSDALSETEISQNPQDALSETEISQTSQNETSNAPLINNKIQNQNKESLTARNFKNFDLFGSKDNNLILIEK